MKANPRYAPYLWLIYLSALVFQPAFDPDTTAVDWAATAAMVVVFLPLYRASLAERDQRRLLVLLAAMAALGVVGSLVNAGAGVFIVYAAALAGRLSPVRRAGTAVAALAGLAGVMFLISPTPMPWRLLAVVPIVVLVLVIGAAGIIDGERARTQAQLRRADEEIERLATIAERERIARDLHDLLGHTLSVIVLKAELATRLLPADPDRAGQEMREVEHTARTALAEVRSAVTGYRAKGWARNWPTHDEHCRQPTSTSTPPSTCPSCPPSRSRSWRWPCGRPSPTWCATPTPTAPPSGPPPPLKRSRLEVCDDGRGAHGAGRFRPGRHARTRHRSRRPRHPPQRPFRGRATRHTVTMQSAPHPDPAVAPSPAARP